MKKIFLLYVLRILCLHEGMSLVRRSLAALFLLGMEAAVLPAPPALPKGSCKSYFFFYSAPVLCTASCAIAITGFVLRSEHLYLFIPITSVLNFVSIIAGECVKKEELVCGFNWVSAFTGSVKPSEKLEAPYIVSYTISFAMGVLNFLMSWSFSNMGGILLKQNLYSILTMCLILTVIHFAVTVLFYITHFITRNDLLRKYTDRGIVVEG